METRKQQVDNHILKVVQDYILKHWDVSPDTIKQCYITAEDLSSIIDYVYGITPYKRNRIKYAIKKKFKIHS